ncbi:MULTISPECIES: hypothetical protein [unclassified Frankia]|uniref:hypothetical protein n=1 Tax=unclassified Frankia TaxID=2632575 RepID=UPI002AD303B6|nr:MULTISPECIES: hypothetical protein [unclassified Frankia]
MLTDSSRSQTSQTSQTDGVLLIRASSDSELQLARNFRNEVFRDRRSVVFSDGLEHHRDANSYVMLLLRDGAPVATARSQPYPSDSSDILGVSPNLPDWGSDSEVGRMAAARSPQSVRYSLMVLALGSMWLLEYTHHRRYIAYCLPKMLKIFRLIGAEDTGETCAVPGRPGRHSIILGRYDDCARIGMNQLGMSHAEARAAIRPGLAGPND